jgi:hypothetical protein
VFLNVSQRLGQALQGDRREEQLVRLRAVQGCADYVMVHVRANVLALVMRIYHEVEWNVMNLTGVWETQPKTKT